MVLRADFGLMTKAGATLLGLSFASLAFAYGSIYSPAMPPTMISRMISFLEWTVPCAFAFLSCCILSFVALTFVKVDSGTRKFLGYSSITTFVAGLAFFGSALLSLIEFTVSVWWSILP